jgi:hypothetical protein
MLRLLKLRPNSRTTIRMRLKHSTTISRSQIETQRLIRMKALRKKLLLYCQSSIKRLSLPTGST